MSHVTFVTSPQLNTDDGLGLLTVVNGAKDCDSPLHVVGSEVLETVRGRGRGRDTERERYLNCGCNKLTGLHSNDCALVQYSSTQAERLHATPLMMLSSHSLRWS